MDHYNNAYSGNKNAEINQEINKTLAEINEIEKQLGVLKDLIYKDEPFLDAEIVIDLFEQHTVLESKYHVAIAVAYIRGC